MLQDFESLLHSNLDRPDYLGGLLEEFAQGGALEEAILDRASSIFEKQLSVISFGADVLLLLRNERYQLLVRKMGDPEFWSVKEARPNLFLTTSPTDSVVVSVSREPVFMDRYDIDRPVDLNAFDPNARLVCTERCNVTGKAVQELRGCQIYDYHSDGAFLQLRLMKMPFADQVWLFDRATLAPSYPASVGGENSMLVNLARMFGAMKTQEAVPELEALWEHPVHYVRWAALQAVGRIDGDRARNMLRGAVDDPHPLIQRAAQRELTKAGA
ncbi:HEAT repeat domain-containing protein [Sphingomonas sp.]|uniref:HEAT repeat domain-containing protein n=1 Tax=Sphingomonas sp. TaxID=28214 RepID=UPI0028A7F547|nr:HEAT repeat domain-containing protein [Sphingomonas sp.]